MSPRLCTDIVKYTGKNDSLLHYDSPFAGDWASPSPQARSMNTLEMLWGDEVIVSDGDVDLDEPEDMAEVAQGVGPNAWS
jgi:hypothetical protein